jgi:hypothetical protein
MATPRQALLRPIEITASNDTITISGTDYTVTARVYANIFDLLTALNATALATAQMSTNWRVQLATSSGTAALTQTPLSDLLGFDGTESGSTLRTATHAPAYCWVSTYQSSMADRWVTDGDMEFHGSMAADGNLYGISMTTRESLTVKWPWESAANAYPAAATTSFIDSAAGVRYPQQYSNFWSVVTGSRTAYPTASSSNNISLKGLYFVPKISDWLGYPSTFDWLSETPWTSGGTKFDVTGADYKDNYVFCTVPDAPRAPQSQRNMLQYYDVEVKLVTAVAPTWETT